MREVKQREEQRKKRPPLKPLQPLVAASPLNRTVAIEGILKTGTVLHIHIVILIYYT